MVRLSTLNHVNARPHRRHVACRGHSDPPERERSAACCVLLRQQRHLSREARAYIQKEDDAQSTRRGLHRRELHRCDLDRDQAEFAVVLRSELRQCDVAATPAALPKIRVKAELRGCLTINDVFV
jgi:hypothetical protein